MITGSQGQLASDIVDILKLYDFDVYAFSKSELDATDKDLLKEAIEKIRPNFFIQGASYHVVEEIENNIEKATKVNIDSLHTAAKACNEVGCHFINFSTNYVFGNVDHKKNDGGYYFEDGYSKLDEGFSEDCFPHPCNVYGILKRTGEQIVETYCPEHWNFRVAGLFGKTGSRSKNGDNFPYHIIKELAEDREVKVVDDQIMNVSYTIDIAKAIVGAIRNGGVRNGVHHLTNTGQLTWFEFAKFISEYKYGNSAAVVPCKTSDFYSKVERPLFSALTSECFILPSWQSGFIRFMKEVEEE